MLQKNEAYKEKQDDDAYENDVQEYRARKRRIMTEESDDNAALRAQQIRKERKFVKKSKYQRLIRFDSLNHNISSKDDTSMNDTDEKDFVLIQRKKLKTSRRQQRITNVTTATMIENTNSSTDFASDFTYKTSQTSSRIT